MFRSHVYISGISIGGNTRDENDITINNETRDQKVNVRGNATISESSLLKGLKAREAIVVKNNTKIQGDTESSMEGVTASDSSFQDIKAREKIKMSNCSAEDVTVTMEGLIAKNTTFHKINTREKVSLTNCSGETLQVSMEGCNLKNSTLKNVEVREKAELENCVIDNRVKISMEGLSWTNDLSYKENFFCKSIEAREKINLTNISAGFVKSSMEKVTATNCNLEEIEARESAKLVNTPAQTIEVSMGPLQVVSQGQTIAPYQRLKAREDISLANIEALNVKSDMGTISAENCVFGNLEVNQSVTIQHSIVNESIKLNIDPLQSSKLLLNNSTIKGDLIIEAISNSSVTLMSDEISIRSSIGKMSIASVDNVTINTSGTYQSISDIPSNVKLMALKMVKEGQKINIGNLECVAKNGTLELAKQEALTLEELKRQIFSVIGYGTICSHLEFNGGIYRVDKGNIEIIKSPSGLIIDSEIKTPSTNSLPMVTIEIIGGKIEGKVIFKNCQGEVKLLDGAQVQTL